MTDISSLSSVLSFLSSCDQSSSLIIIASIIMLLFLFVSLSRISCDQSSSLIMSIVMPFVQSFRFTSEFAMTCLPALSPPRSCCFSFSLSNSHSSCSFPSTDLFVWSVCLSFSGLSCQGRLIIICK